MTKDLLNSMKRVIFTAVIDDQNLEQIRTERLFLNKVQHVRKVNGIIIAGDYNAVFNSWGLTFDFECGRLKGLQIKIWFHPAVE